MLKTAVIVMLEACITNVRVLPVPESVTVGVVVMLDNSYPSEGVMVMVISEPCLDELTFVLIVP